MTSLSTWILGFSSFLAVILFYIAGSSLSQNLSPQGCRMSWMSPSYVLQTNFNTSWSHLSNRYSLWLYREVGWDSIPETETGFSSNSLPVLFIPGNAGSSHQVRSIASSSTRQYFSLPNSISPAFESRSLKTLDFFAVEFNEDLSAFHGSTLESQIAFTSRAISYILSLYPTNTTIIIMGHSMGGIVATSLLPSKEISTIITMSTPHTLPPARFDSKIEALYSKLHMTLQTDLTPIVSLCGGATDMMIPSESCVLPKTPKDVYRKTIFTSALEGAWTGIGHREMVWCHQVRWRVARAALELGGVASLDSKISVLNRWLRDGSEPNALSTPDEDEEDKLNLSEDNSIILDAGQKLFLNGPQSSKAYLLPVQSNSQKLSVLVSQGTLASVAPQNSIPLHVTVFDCMGRSITSARCRLLKPEILKLIPNPAPGKSFPVPDEGSDESEGVVLFESYVFLSNEQHWIAINIKVDKADGHGWVIADLSSERQIVSEISAISLVVGSAFLSVPTHEALSTSFTFPNLMANVLVVYRVTPILSIASCSDSILPPLLVHSSYPGETHYYQLSNGPRSHALLHTHLPAPLIDSSQHSPSFVNLTIYSSPNQQCRDSFTGLEITIDWRATFGRWATRYLTTLICWAAGIASVVVFIAWGHQDKGGFLPSIWQSIDHYIVMFVRYLLPGSFVLSYIPLPESLYLGNVGRNFLAPIAPLLLLVASGLVIISSSILQLSLKVVGKSSALFLGRPSEKVSVPRSTVVSLMIICAAIFLFIPWQVAYLGCWLLHFYTCALSMHYIDSNPDWNSDAVPLMDRSSGVSTTVSHTLSTRRPHGVADAKRENLYLNIHLLLLMTWLLPLTAPVLAVWVRTLLTAGYTTPFDGDHNFLAVVPFLVYTDFATWTPGKLFNKTRIETHISFRWLFALIAVTSFIYGSRKPYLVADVARVSMWIIVLLKIGPRYWGGSAWMS